MKFNKYMEEDINKILKKLEGQVIQKFSVKQNTEQYFHLVTDKVDVKFGANDLDAWIEEYRELKKDKN